MAREEVQRIDRCQEFGLLKDDASQRQRGVGLNCRIDQVDRGRQKMAQLPWW